MYQGDLKSPSGVSRDPACGRLHILRVSRAFLGFAEMTWGVLEFLDKAVRGARTMLSVAHAAKAHCMSAVSTHMQGVCATAPHLAPERVEHNACITPAFARHGSPWKCCITYKAFHRCTRCSTKGVEGKVGDAVRNTGKHSVQNWLLSCPLQCFISAPVSGRPMSLYTYVYMYVYVCML